MSDYDRKRSNPTYTRPLRRLDRYVWSGTPASVAPKARNPTLTNHSVHPKLKTTAQTANTNNTLPNQRPTRRCAASS
ncbi:hypothetical protein GCM10007392_21690 [Saccharospirillum salsuginis]|uniref:Uncharacterized protein n=1 Tax=Saccharospirillum salsuginis TaxID=418750 RepID=A0A918NAQ4_9GAMM|nr:hypothetical protein GCM10007392_21690 [Saccharospirillum salsuginis]